MITMWASLLKKAQVRIHSNTYQINAGKAVPFSMPLQPKEYCRDCVYNFVMGLLPDTEIKQNRNRYNANSNQPFDPY